MIRAKQTCACQIDIVTYNGSSGVCARGLLLVCCMSHGWVTNVKERTAVGGLQNSLCMEVSYERRHEERVGREFRRAESTLYFKGCLHRTSVVL